MVLTSNNHSSTESTQKRRIHFKNGVVKCPNCGKTILFNMQVCNHCHHHLTTAEYRAIRSQLVYGVWGWLFRIFIGIALIALVLNILFS